MHDCNTPLSEGVAMYSCQVFERNAVRSKADLCDAGVRPLDMIVRVAARNPSDKAATSVYGMVTENWQGLSTPTKQ